MKAERLLYSALIGYIWYEAPAKEMNFITLLELINASEARADGEEYQFPLEKDFLEESGMEIDSGEKKLYNG